MPESLQSRWYRWLFNLYPAYRRTGGRVRYLSADLREMRVELPLNWQTRNYVGTIYGGCIYGCVDPMMMMILMRALGPGYLVWDKAASIKFLKPGRSTLSVDFKLADSELEEIRTILRTSRSVDRRYVHDLRDAHGVLHARVEKTIYIRRKDVPARADEKPPGNT